MKMRKIPGRWRNALILLPLSAALSAVLFIILSNPGPPDETELELYFRAVNAYEEGRLDIVLSLTGVLSENNPAFHQARLLRAKALFFSDRLEEAASSLQALMKDIENYTEAGIWLMRVRIQQKEIQAASEVGEKLLSKAPEDPRILGLSARIAFLENDYQKSIEYYNRAILFEEDLAINRIELAKIYSSLLNTAEAVRHLKKALVMLPDDSLLRSGISLLIEKQGEI